MTGGCHLKRGGAGLKKGPRQLPVVEYEALAGHEMEPDQMMLQTLHRESSHDTGIGQITDAAREPVQLTVVSHAVTSYLVDPQLPGPRYLAALAILG